MLVGILGYCYWKVTQGITTLSTIDKILPIIILGIISTILIFWSMSGFILRLVQTKKQIYLKGTNMFILRQIHNKINTTVVSMSVICLMLFVTITILSTAISLRNTMESDLKEMTPVDLNLHKTAYLPEKSTNLYGKEIVYTNEQREDSKKSIEYTLTKNGFDMNKLKEVVQIPTYAIDEITIQSTLGSTFEQAKQEYPMMKFSTVEQIIKVSDYNKIAEIYGIDKYYLNDNEYIILCDYDNIANIRNKGLKDKNPIKINGKEYLPKYNECKNGFIEISVSHMNTGIILVPDSCEFKQEEQKQWFLAANYNAKTEEEKQEIEKDFVSDDSALIQNLANNGIEIDGNTKISLIQSSVGLVTIVLFIAIYLGVIFLIASSAILSLKQLTESSDNKQRYIILRKIGCDEKMINQALFRQIGIFFAIPLILAIVHSVFGIQFGIGVMAGLASKQELIPSAIVTLVLISLIYGLYFMATYLGSKNIIKEE